MKEQQFLSVSDFAKLSRTTKDTLYHYDRIGLLDPLLRKKNNYRYYSIRQLALVNVVRTLQELGIALSDIKDFKDQRTPEQVDCMLLNQIESIDKKISSWVAARKLILTLQKTIHSALDVDEDAITIQFMPSVAIVCGELNDYSMGRDHYDALLKFYHSMQNDYPDINLNYPVWGIFSEQRIRQKDWTWPDRYYFFNPEGYDRRPAALYAIGYTRGGYGQSSKLFERMVDFIEESGFEICGDTYEEYPLNEICISEDTNYLIRLMITVREKT